MNPVLAFDARGLKNSQFPTDTETAESLWRASYTSDIGPSGVSAQTTKPTKTTVIISRKLRIILFLRRILSLA
jgi:hypothetical protein